MMKLIAYGLILSILGVGGKWVWDVWQDQFAGLLFKYITTIAMGVAMMILCAAIVAKFPVSNESFEVPPSKYAYARSNQKVVYVYQREHVAKTSAYLHKNAGDSTKVKVEATKWFNLLDEHFTTTISVEKK